MQNGNNNLTCPPELIDFCEVFLLNKVAMYIISPRIDE